MNFMSNWQNFWSNDPKLFRIVMQKSTAYFANQILKRKIISPQDTILDFGCGPGYLAEQLIDNVQDYYGVDISSAYIDTCQKKFAGDEHFHFSTLTASPTSIGLNNSPLIQHKFNVIIILSVVQYFPDLAKVEALLAESKSLLSAHGKIILADVIQSDQGLIKDALSVLINSLKKNYFFPFLKFMYQVKFSNYNQLRLKNNLLSISETEIASICKKLNLQYQLLPNCTLQHSRVSYCITAL
jgi:cyclopropane fatty-acyl-phospholipid synthase-like methyltransferase